ncbi:CoF synthetase [Maribacter aestuarii]|uniref:CoF synthetase n=1 Tax=Maribacter aestuarii TaxID=1130723 RepID=UPI00248B8733|nr:CoF synthetase [Maribacter aestuarii]
MRILEQIRRLLFWSLDNFKDNSIKSHLEDISFILENFTSEKSKQRRDSILYNYLKHAVDSTPWYFKFKGFKDISDFPVISKIDIREAYEDMLSLSYRDKPFTEIATSGTTGIPFRVRQDKIKKNRNLADTLYFGKKGGYVLGDRLYYVRKWVPETSRTAFGNFLINMVEVNVTDFSKSYLDKLISRMELDVSNKALIGYSSAFTDICRHLESENRTPLERNFKSIIAVAEALSPNTKKSMETFFGCPVVTRYSNSENGIFAQQSNETGDDYHINWASYYVEILQLDNDNPVSEGQMGRIVITDLFNYCMPMIRYDTGDLGVMEKRDKDCAPLLTKIEGRRMDVLYSTKGEPLSPYVAFEMEYFTELKQFQLIQESEKEYTAKLNLDGVFMNEEGLIKRLKKYLGKDAVIKFEYVKAFPQLASGKRRLTVNNYKKVV